MLDISEVKRVANIVSRRLQGGGSFTDVARKVIRAEIPKDQREEFLTAVASELSGRKHPKDTHLLPDAPSPKGEVNSVPEDSQLGFGEGPRHKIRPPTRRHL